MSWRTFAERIIPKTEVPPETAADDLDDEDDDEEVDTGRGLLQESRPPEGGPICRHWKQKNKRAPKGRNHFNRRTREM
ncbi:MAG: hypothetical protein KF712_03520 [Akkermansiaceae bacterium]|nr:hypothetical protein [Akkermansiaceae bacterium]